MIQRSRGVVIAPLSFAKRERSEHTDDRVVTATDVWAIVVTATRKTEQKQTDN
jgi:hypothetical protein